MLEVERKLLSTAALQVRSIKDKWDKQRKLRRDWRVCIDTLTKTPDREFTFININRTIARHFQTQ